MYNLHLSLLLVGSSPHPLGKVERSYGPVKGSSTITVSGKEAGTNSWPTTPEKKKRKKNELVVSTVSNPVWNICFSNFHGPREKSRMFETITYRLTEDIWQLRFEHFSHPNRFSSLEAANLTTTTTTPTIFPLSIGTGVFNHCFLCSSHVSTCPCRQPRHLGPKWPTCRQQDSHLRSKLRDLSSSRKKKHPEDTKVGSLGKQL